MTPRSRAERQAAVLEHFENNPESSLAAAQAALGIPIATLNRDVDALKEKGLLSRDGPHGRRCISRQRLVQ